MFFFSSHLWVYRVNEHNVQGLLKWHFFFNVCPLLIYKLLLGEFQMVIKAQFLMFLTFCLYKVRIWKYKLW